MNTLYLLQFASLIFMLVNAALLAMSRLHVRWENRRSFSIWHRCWARLGPRAMMRQFPDYNNDIISAECGFFSRTYLYRIFKEKTGKTPMEWRDVVTSKIK